MTIPKLPPELATTAAQVLTGRKAASVAAGMMLAIAMPAEQREHLQALVEWMTGGQAWAAAVALLGASVWGSAAHGRGRAGK